MLLPDIIQIAMLVVIIGQLFLAYRTFKANHERQRKQATFEFVNAVSDRYKQALFKFNKKHGGGKIIDLSEYDDDDRYLVKSYLGEIERICAGVNSNVFDYEILRKMMATNLIRSNHRFKQYILDSRHSEQRPNLYIEFDQVVDILKKDNKVSYNNIGAMKHS